MIKRSVFPTSFRGWSLSSDANGSLDSSTRGGLHGDIVKIWGKMQVNGPSVRRLPDYRHHFTPFQSEIELLSAKFFSVMAGENLKILRKYIQKSEALHLGRNIFCFRLSALIDYTSTSNEIISLTDLIKSAKLSTRACWEDAELLVFVSLRLSSRSDSFSP